LTNISLREMDIPEELAKVLFNVERNSRIDSRLRSTVR